MHAMGLDVGDKRIGIAVADELGWTAQGVTVLLRTQVRADLNALVRLATDHRVDQFVVGLPLNMDGSEGPRAHATRAFGESLGRVSKLPVEYWDERLSTAEVERVLVQADVSRAKRRQVVDKLAAQVILQGWLDAQARARAKETE